MPPAIRLLAAAASLAAVPCAQLAPYTSLAPESRSASAELDTFLVRSATTTDVVARVQGASGTAALLIATPSGAFQPMIVGTLRLTSAGAGAHTIRASNALLASLPMGLSYDFTALYVDPATNGIVQTPWTTLALGAQPCEFLGFNVGPSGIPLVAGEEVLEQFASIGLHVSADNKTPGHPDKVIVFDSAHPTGEDDDLMTPGPGPNNNTPLGNLMIVAEDDVDLNGDGLVDDPDDEEGGGIVTFDFDEPASFCSITLVDLDDGGGSVIRFFMGATLQDTLPLPPAGNNSVTTVAGLAQEFDRMEVDFRGSGAIASFGFVFCPTVVSFDEFTTGMETELVAGEELTSQLASIGMTVSAMNALAGHPDKAILFDSAAPTGEDDDLLTPGPGIGNNTPRGLVLIIAEDDVDLDANGLVDDPDDEQFGGVLAFDFAFDVSFRSATVLDVDTDETSFFVLRDDGGMLIAQIPLASLGENSSQTVTQEVGGVRRVELHLGGSGALAELRFCPEVGSLAAN